MMIGSRLKRIVPSELSGNLACLFITQLFVGAIFVIALIPYDHLCWGEYKIRPYGFSRIETVM